LFYVFKVNLLAAVAMTPRNVGRHCTETQHSKMDHIAWLKKQCDFHHKDCSLSMSPKASGFSEILSILLKFCPLIPSFSKWPTQDHTGSGELGIALFLKSVNYCQSFIWRWSSSLRI